MKKEWHIHKFGGTSLANADLIKQVLTILLAEKGSHKAVVVSAFGGVTDHLIRVGELAVQGDEHYVQELEELKVRHLSEIKQLLPDLNAVDLEENIGSDFRKIAEILRGVLLSCSLSMQTKEFISGFGEIWSAQIINQFILSEGINSIWLDARKVIVVYHNETGICVDWERTRENFQTWYEKHSKYQWIIITGYIASNLEHIPTTLGRNGSDFSASIFGALFRSIEITIWTDVDGVLSADPKLVPDAVVLKSMSYNEAIELAYFGAKVLHPATMAPAIEFEIPIIIRNTFNSTQPGTRISNISLNCTQTVRAISVIEHMALLTVEGTGMIGVPGIAQRLFGALKEAKISVVLISQASSEHSICLAVPKEQSYLAKNTLEKAFFAELYGKQISSIAVSANCGILAAVGDLMADQPGIAAKLFGALAIGGVNIRAIAQGASERNISIVIDQHDLQRSLRMVHSAFFLSNQTLSVGIFGVGNVGKTLIDQIHMESQRLKYEMNIDLKIRGIANSKNMLLSEDSMNLEKWNYDFVSSSVPLDVAKFVAHIKSEHLPHCVLVDCTANDNLSKQYPDWLSNGINVVSANKKANTENIDFYNLIRRVCKKANTQFLYETNVGASLPIINTLQELIQTGDKIEKIEGIFSGTMSYLFNNFNGSISFSELVKRAQKLGYTEPDPKEDLSGIDVARKLVILSREIGLQVELKDVEVENLALHNDEYMKVLLDDCNDKHQVLRHVGTIIPHELKIKVGIEVYPVNHSFARISGSDNIVAFKTKRYSSEPLIIQGAGAGPAVTAAGVFADLLRLVHSFGGDR